MLLQIDSSTVLVPRLVILSHFIIATLIKKSPRYEAILHHEFRVLQLKYLPQKHSLQDII